MTLDTFFRRLRTVQTKWRLDKFHNIRNIKDQCPLEAVYNQPAYSYGAKKDGKRGWHPRDMSQSDCNAIITSADNEGLAILRSRLLRACRIKNG